MMNRLQFPWSEGLSSGEARCFQIVAEAYSVEEAMEAYRAKRPDVVVTDMKMPGGKRRRADQIRNAAGKAGNLRGGQRLFGF